MSLKRVLNEKLTGPNFTNSFMTKLKYSFIPWIENPAFPALFFFFSNKKNAVNWTVKPGQDPLNPVRIGYIDIKRYFRAMYLHK